MGIEFRELMQADFILFLRDALSHPKYARGWWPETRAVLEEAVVDPLS